MEALLSIKGPIIVTDQRDANQQDSMTVTYGDGSHCVQKIELSIMIITVLAAHALMHSSGIGLDILAQQKRSRRSSLEHKEGTPKGRRLVAMSRDGRLTPAACSSGE